MECYDCLPMNIIDTGWCYILAEAFMRLSTIRYNEKSKNLGRTSEDIN